MTYLINLTMLSKNDPCITHHVPEEQREELDVLPFNFSDAMIALMFGSAKDADDDLGIIFRKALPEFGSRCYVFAHETSANAVVSIAAHVCRRHLEADVTVEADVISCQHTSPYCMLTLHVTECDARRRAKKVARHWASRADRNRNIRLSWKTLYLMVFDAVIQGRIERRRQRR